MKSTIFAIIALTGMIFMTSNAYAFTDVASVDNTWDVLRDKTWGQNVYYNSDIADDFWPSGSPLNFDTNGKFYVVEKSLVPELTFDEKSYAFATAGNLEVIVDHKSNPNWNVSNTQNTLFVTDSDIAVITEDQYNDIFGHKIVSDVSAAPHLSGWSTSDANRVTFTGVMDNCIFVMSTTEIKVLTCKATERYVGLFIDGIFVETIDIGVDPGRTTDGFINMGGMTLDIPFEANYHVTQTGQLVYKGQDYKYNNQDVNEKEE